MKGDAVTIANDQTLMELIATARERLVVLAPAVSNAVGRVIADQWHALGADRVSVILDVDSEVYRLGYGDIEALQELDTVATRLGAMVNRHKGIRVGLVVADDRTMVYSPTPMLVEAGPRDANAPNAIMLSSAPQEVERELGLGPQGVRDRRIGEDKATKAEIAEVTEELRKNPPQKFDVARTMRVFNSLIEFVEFELLGTMLERHKAKLPPELMGFANADDAQQLIEAQFRLIDKDSSVSGAHLQEIKASIVDQYLTLLPRYGYVILRAKKDEFQQRIDAFEQEVEAFAEQVRTTLADEMKDNRERIIKALLPAVRQSPPPRWGKQFAGKPTDEQLRKMLDAALQRAFGGPEKHIRAMRVRVVFKGVTHESLTDPDFVKVAMERLPALEHLHREFQAVEAKHDSAPARRPL